MGIFDGLSARFQAWSDKRAAKKESKKRAASLADQHSPPGGAAQPSAASSAAAQIAHPRQQQQVQPSDEDDEWDEEIEAAHAQQAHRQSLPSLGQHLQNQSSASIALAQGNALPPGSHRDARSASMFHPASGCSAPPLVGHHSGSGGFRSSSPTSMPQHSAASQISTPHGYQRQFYPHSGLGSSPSSDLSMMRSSAGGLHSLHTTPQRNTAASFGPASAGGAGVGPAEHKEAGGADHDLFCDELESGLQMSSGGGAGGRQLYRGCLFGGQPSADAPAQTDDEKFAELLQQQEYLAAMEESGEISHADATALARSASAQREKEARRAARRKAKDSERAARAAAAALSSGSSVSSSASSAAAAAPSAGAGASSLPPFPPLSLQLPASLPSSPVHVDSPSPTPSPDAEESGAAAPSPAALRAFKEFRARATQQFEAAAASSSSSSAGAYRPHAMSVSNSSHQLHPHHHMQAHPLRTQSNVEDRGLPPPFLHGGHSAHHSAHNPQSSSNSPSRSLSYSHSMSSHHHHAGGGVHTPTSVSASASSFVSSPHQHQHQPHNATLAHSSSTPVQRASSLSRAELNSLPTFLYVPSPSSVLAKKEAKEKAAAAQKLEAERVAAVAAATALLAQVSVTETLVVAATDPPTAATAAPVVVAGSEPLAAPKPLSPLPSVSTALVLEAVVVDCATTATAVLSPAPSEEEASSMDSCSICLDDYGRADKLRCLPCLHRYHAECIDDWLSRSSVCPNCNVDVREAFN